MAASSAQLPESPSEFSPHWFGGTISVSPDSPNLKASADLSIYFLQQEWRNHSLCNDPDESPPDFFPERGVPGEDIRDFCFMCPVRLQCLDYSVQTMPKFGWFGGHPEEGRRSVRRLVRKGSDLETADAVVLADALAKIRQRKKAEQGRKYDIYLGDEVAGEFNLQPAM